MKHGRAIWYPAKYLPPHGTRARRLWDAQEEKIKDRQMIAAAKAERRREAAERRKRNAEFKKAMAAMPIVGKGSKRAFFLGIKETDQ